MTIEPFKHCAACNSPRTGDACRKCGGPLRDPHPDWKWPRLPDVEPIRALAKEKGYAVGVHGTLERDLDLIAAPWTDKACSPQELADHIAQGINGVVLAPEAKPLGRWSCNIQIDGWFKLIDLSVAPALSGAQRSELTRPTHDEPVPSPPSTGGEGEAVAWAMLQRDGSVLSVQAKPYHEGFAQMMATDCGCTVQALGPVHPSPEMGEIRSDIEQIIIRRLMAGRIEGYTLEMAEEIASKLKENGLSREELGGSARSLPGSDAQERSPVPPISDGGGA